MAKDDPKQLAALVAQGVFEGYEARYEVTGRSPAETADPADSIRASQEAKDSTTSLIDELNDSRSIITL